MFFPIYEQLEKELIDLGFYISFDRKQKLTYSIKIADLILRTVSEIENLAFELCKIEQIKFREEKEKNKGKNKKKVNFHEYISALSKIYDLEHKTVNFVHKNASEDCFENNLPFQKYLQKDGKET